MERFLTVNPGVASRFSRTITFGDYGPEELLRIVEQQAEEHEYRLGEGAGEALLKYFTAIPKGPAFGNGRTARQTFEAMVERHAGRVAQLDEPEHGRPAPCSTRRTCPSCPEPALRSGPAPSGAVAGCSRAEPQQRGPLLGEGRVGLVVGVAEDRRGQRVFARCGRRRAGP